MTTPLFDDLDVCVDDALGTLAPLADRDWQAPAVRSTWTCWEVLEHVADDLFAYAAQLTARRRGPQSDYVPFVCEVQRRGGPPLTIRSQPEQRNSGLLEVLDACGGLLSAAVRSASPDQRAWHPCGVSDPAGFAAMGVVETMVHLHDVSQPLGFTWSPRPDVVRRSLDRLFPDAPQDHDPWPTMLWATGRGELPGQASLTTWRWDSTVRM